MKKMILILTLAFTSSYSRGNRLSKTDEMMVHYVYDAIRDWSDIPNSEKNEQTITDTYTKLTLALYSYKQRWDELEALATLKIYKGLSQYLCSLNLPWPSDKKEGKAQMQMIAVFDRYFKPAQTNYDKALKLLEEDYQKLISQNIN